jgi:hypothetical protein
MSELAKIITSADPVIRNQALDAFCRRATLAELLAECDALDVFRRESDNLYERVRALFFLYAIHRFHLLTKAGMKPSGLVPFTGYEHLLQRRFEEAISSFLHAQQEQGPNETVSSALAEAYHRLGFQTLADQVRRSVRTVRGNQWMFRMGHPSDQPLRVRPELLRRPESAVGEGSSFPILRERTPVRMDLSHSAWSDIFFLGMDFPEGARVLNVSIDLAVRGRDAEPRPPVEGYFRVIDEPVLRLTSVDLGATAEITEIRDVFDFAKDYLGLLKAAIIASGILPPGIEGSGQSLTNLLARLVGPGLGIELVSSVNDIPKGSRLAVSTNLLACLIGVCMRATGQAKSLAGQLQESERRLVAARAILGEWLAGSGGGWQDSGGVWPGMKLIQGVLASEGDPESGVSRGRLLPSHKILDECDAPPAVREQLCNSLILVHGGMAQNVGPILEMVTEKYLLRSEAEWRGRKEAMGVLDDIVTALREGGKSREAVQRIGATTMRNFFGPIQAIIPWASNFYTETLIERTKTAFGKDFWGFWMLGGMSGGGMGFIVAPEIKRQAQDRLQEIMLRAKGELQHALPFAMDPVVYDFGINPQGTFADVLGGDAALMPMGYYAMHMPQWLRLDQRTLSPMRRAELQRFGAACRTRPELGGMTKTLFDRLLPQIKRDTTRGGTATLAELLERFGFDSAQHEQIRADLKNGRIGLAQNRLPANTTIEDVRPDDVCDATDAGKLAAHRQRGIEALRAGEVGVVSLAAGAGSRWTQGAGVVKALNPFARFGGKHRTFLGVHFAKSRRMSRLHGAVIPHVVTTSYLTHEPIEEYLAASGKGVLNSGVKAFLSPGRSVGLRMIPMARDLRFAWEEMPQQLLDEQAQKVRESLHTALIGWAQHAGEGSDYTDNLPMQCLHPVGHWFEVSNMLRNGLLAQLLRDYPRLKYLMLHNIDTLGADLDPAMVGLNVSLGACLTFEVITRHVHDRGGGLARVDGHVRLVEGLAMPREEAEFALSYYNTLTTWIDVQQLLNAFGLTRGDLTNEATVTAAIRKVSARIPTYITLKDVKKRWGHGQEDVFPVAQFEKLWGDMTWLPDVACKFVVVTRMRGQQLKDAAQLDGWLRDGSAAYVERLCDWQ